MWCCWGAGSGGCWNTADGAAERCCSASSRLTPEKSWLLGAAACWRAAGSSRMECTRIESSAIHRGRSGGLQISWMMRRRVTAAEVAKMAIWVASGERNQSVVRRATPPRANIRTSVGNGTGNVYGGMPSGQCRTARRASLGDRLRLRFACCCRAWGRCHHECGLDNRSGVVTGDGEPERE